MGRGSSGANRGGGGGGAKKPTTPAGTPSGITYDQFMKMSDSEKYDTIESILADPNIQVPSYLDDSNTTKFLYGLGLNNKPTVVSDDQLDNMAGKDLYRTVYETGSMPPPSTDAVLDQIRNGDYTHMSGKGGSAHGRAIYFARDDFVGSRYYGDGERNAMMMRGKLKPNAKIVSEHKLKMSAMNDSNFDNRRISLGADGLALYALSHGIDGWYSGTYIMMVNRGAMTFSSKNKSIYKKGARKTYSNAATSWAEAGDA